jgi:hypothetical protein
MDAPATWVQRLTGQFKHSNSHELVKLTIQQIIAQYEDGPPPSSKIFRIDVVCIIATESL